MTTAWTEHRSKKHFSCVSAFTLVLRSMLQVVVVTSLHLKWFPPVTTTNMCMFLLFERATREHDLVCFRLCENTHTHSLPVTVLHLCTVLHPYESGVSESACACVCEGGVWDNAVWHRYVLMYEPVCVSGGVVGNTKCMWERGRWLGAGTEPFQSLCCFLHLSVLHLLHSTFWHYIYDIFTKSHCQNSHDLLATTVSFYFPTFIPLTITPVSSTDSEVTAKFLLSP